MMERVELPNECEETIEHAQMHLNNIAKYPDDKDQALHEVDMAYRILNNILANEWK